jgi:hypothetical protein
MWSRDRDVDIVGRTIKWGMPWGDGNLEWGGNGEEEVSLRATWDQGGRDRTTQKEGFQVSKRDLRKERNWQGKIAKENQQGE